MKILVAGALVMAATTPGAASAVAYYDSEGAVSTYVRDWAQGAAYTNYAFKVATSSFVGSWRVDQGPSWSTVPVVYSGLDAAALLFGGSPTDYFISTVDSDPANADHQAWASRYNWQCETFGACGVKVDEGFMFGSSVARATITSAIPEPASWTLMVAGFGLIGLGVRRRRGPALARG